MDLPPEELAAFRESTWGVAELVREKAGDQFVELPMGTVDEVTDNWVGNVAGAGPTPRSGFRDGFLWRAP